RGAQDGIVEVRTTDGYALRLKIDVDRLDAGDLFELGANSPLAMATVHSGDGVGALGQHIPSAALYLPGVPCAFSLRCRAGTASPPASSASAAVLEVPDRGDAEA